MAECFRPGAPSLAALGKRRWGEDIAAFALCFLGLLKKPPFAITSRHDDPTTFEAALERVKELVSIFSQDESQSLSLGYSEAQARQDFIDKFWIALGWDANLLHSSTARSFFGRRNLRPAHEKQRFSD